MKRWNKHIGQWLSGMLMLLLMAACTSSTEEETQKPKVKPVLKIYLFAPESPIVTRSDNGNVNATDDEKDIKTLDIWVFEHTDEHKLVSYLHLNELSFDGQREIAMEITDEFANMAKKHNVDIFVAANASNLGLDLNKNTTIAQLKEKCIGNDYFGVASDEKLVKSVPENGLPMSGLLENEVVSGIPPVYSAKANYVKLVRAVSKVRFVFSKSSSGAPTISDLTIKLNANVLPKEEYLFLEDVYPTKRNHIKTASGYNESEATLVSKAGDVEINSCTNPAEYIYTSQTGQEYETMIDNALKDPDGDEGELKPDLTQIGCFYLRESDKKLAGTITYKVNGVQRSTPAEFALTSAGDFTRNHTWIVYGYFLGSGELKLSIVDVMDWTTNSENPTVYNW